MAPVDSQDTTDGSGKSQAAGNPWQSPADVKPYEAPTNAQSEPEADENKSDVKRGSLALVDQAVCSGTNFLTMAILARSLTMPVMGAFSLAFLWFQFARTIQERSLAAPYLVFTHRPEHDSRTLLGSNLIHQAIFATLVCLVTLVSGLAMLKTGNPPGVGAGLVALSLAIPFLLLRDQLRAVSLAHFRMEVSLAMNIAVAVIQLGGIGLLVAMNRVSVSTAMAVLGVACLIPAIGWLWVQPQPFRIAREKIFSDWKTFWGFSRWLVLARAVGIGGQYLVPALVAIKMDAASVGAFSVCTALVGLSMMFILGLNNFAQPRIVVAYQEGGVSGMLRAVLQTVACFAFFLGAAALLLFFLGGPLLGSIYSPPYAAYGNVAAILSLGMLTVSVSIAFQNGLAAMGKPHGFLWGEFSYCITAVGLAALLIPRWGLVGAASSLVIAGIVVSVVTIVTLFAIIRDENSRMAHAATVPGSTN